MYGDQFVTILTDGLEIVWRPLTIGEFVEFDKLIKSNKYPIGFIEDEIFRKCVKNKFLVNNLSDIKAGIVSTVVTTILQYSGPSSIDELNYFLNLNRAVSREIIHEIIGYICWAFPAYKPEDLYNLDYHTLMLRLAQAETKLGNLGLISQPFSFLSPEQEKQQKESPKKKKTDDLLERYYERDRKSITKEKPQNKKQTIITSKDMKEHESVYVGHEVEDKAILEASMVNETTKIYQDYLNQSKKHGKIQIKTTEERIAEGKLRAKVNEDKINQINKRLAQEDRKLQEVISQKNQSKKENKRKPGRRK